MTLAATADPNPDSTPDFDAVARPYRWFEYLTFGLALQRCRTHFIPLLLDRKRALVLGDGDGRFLAQLLAANTHLRTDAVDTSAAMLRLLEARTAQHAGRLQTYHADALTFSPASNYDLVVTHFFLDCLSQPELETLIRRLAPTLQPNALWLVSDFHIPSGFMRLPARILIRSLYLAFRILTGLRTTQLPGHAAPLAASGFTLVAEHRSLAGLLTTQLWQQAFPARTIVHMSSPPTPDPTSAHDPIPPPEPAPPSLDQPDPGVFHPDPETPENPASPKSSSFNQ